MAFVQFSKVSLAFGDRDILKDVSVNLQTGTKAALTGSNGAGKSTLIKIMAGLVEPDSGERVAQKDTRIAYLPQSGLVHHGCSLKEEADKAFQWGYEIQEKIDEIGERMKLSPDQVDALAVEHSELLSRLEDSGWYRRDALSESVLLGLGFSREDFSKQTEEFSGGWQMRIALAKALMCGPDILLLDARIRPRAAAHGNGIERDGVIVGKRQCLVDKHTQFHGVIRTAVVLFIEDAGTVLTHRY